MTFVDKPRVVVAEVHSNGDVVAYEPFSFNLDDCGNLLDLWGPMEDRNFFLATETTALTPLPPNSQEC